MADKRLARTVGQLCADSAENQCVASGKSGAGMNAQAPVLPGFVRLLRCGEDLCSFSEILGGGSQKKFVICATWAAQSEPSQPEGAFEMGAVLNSVISVNLGFLPTFSASHHRVICSWR